MLVYLITNAPLVPMRWLLRLVYHLLLYIKLRQFQQALSQRLGWPVALKISYGKYFPSVSFTVPSYPAGNDWSPQFIFGFSYNRRGILLHYLTFPHELRHRQHGLFCVDWVKQLAAQFGLQYLVLGAYPEAEGFWLKMGFSRLTLAEWHKYWC